MSRTKKGKKGPGFDKGYNQRNKKRMADGLKQGLEEAVQIQKDDLLSKLPVAKNCKCKLPCRINCIWDTKTYP